MSYHEQLEAKREAISTEIRAAVEQVETLKEERKELQARAADGDPLAKVRLSARKQEISDLRSHIADLTRQRKKVRVNPPKEQKKRRFRRVI